jgi:hypothetical protein
VRATPLHQRVRFCTLNAPLPRASPLSQPFPPQYVFNPYMQAAAAVRHMTKNVACVGEVDAPQALWDRAMLLIGLTREQVGRGSPGIPARMGCWGLSVGRFRPGAGSSR